MQCNPSLDLCNPTPSWWLGWVGWGWQARQFGFTTLYILQPQTMDSCMCCRVFYCTFGASTFRPHSTKDQNDVCLQVMVFVTLCLAGWAYLWGCLSDAAIIPQIWWLARFCPGQAFFLHYLHFTTAGAEVINCAHSAQGCAAQFVWDKCSLCHTYVDKRKDSQRVMHWLIPLCLLSGILDALCNLFISPEYPCSYFTNVHAKATFICFKSYFSPIPQLPVTVWCYGCLDW